MKQKIFPFLLLLAFVGLAFSARAVHVDRMPVTCVQPNGDTLHCFVTGDEYYHRLHDAQGYTIVRNPKTGYYVYAMEREGQLVPSSYVAGSVSPAAKQLRPNLCLSEQEIRARVQAWQVPAQYALPQSSFSPKNSTFTTTNHGVLNNIVIYIRFSDESAMTQSATTIDTMFNDTSALSSVSMRSYFRSASYNQIDVSTTFYPTPSGSTILSYQDSHPRSYYQPYDTTNANGYQTDAERRSREFSLMESAVQYVNANSPVPASLNIDADGDGQVDNICFIVSGTYTGWSDLLWPHKWSLYDRYVYINGKRVYTFNLQLENSGSHYFSVSTFCHEMFHTLGAPDLYHYYNYTNVSPAGSWDLMCSNTTPPQHMSAFMKYRYGNWLDTIPEIVNPGRYTLRAMASGRDNFCYRIPSQDPSQFYLLEYRRQSERYESALPNSGLLIWRIDTRYNGNAAFDDSTFFDEVYLFRRDGVDDTTAGSVSHANFSSTSVRSAFNGHSNPSPWLTGNVADSTIALSGFTNATDSTISFTYATTRAAEPVGDSTSCYLTVKMSDAQADTWNGAALRLEASNGHLYGSAFLGIATADSATEHIRVRGGDSIRLRWAPGFYPEECGFCLLNAHGDTLYACTDASTQPGLMTVTANGCSSHYVIRALSSDTAMGLVSGGGSYAAGDTATLVATATAHHHFDQWLCNGSVAGTGDTLRFAVTQSKTFTALFAATQYQLTVVSEDTLRGSASSNGSSYAYDDAVRVSAHANSGYAFSHWTFGTGSTVVGDSLTSNPYYFHMPGQDTLLTAHFRRSSVGIHAAAAAKPHVYGLQHAIRICGATGQRADICDVMGRVVASRLLCTSDRQTVAVQRPGLYMVRLGDRAYKVWVTDK